MEKLLNKAVTLLEITKCRYERKILQYHIKETKSYLNDIDIITDILYKMFELDIISGNDYCWYTDKVLDTKIAIQEILFDCEHEMNMEE